MESLIKDFEYQVREAISAVQDRAAAQKLSKQAEQRIAKLRRNSKNSLMPAWSRTRPARTRGSQRPPA